MTILPEAGKYIPKLDDAKSEQRKSFHDDDIISVSRVQEPQMFPFLRNAAVLKELHDEKERNYIRPSRNRNRGYSELNVIDM